MQETEFKDILSMILRATTAKYISFTNKTYYHAVIVSFQLHQRSDVFKEIFLLFYA